MTNKKPNQKLISFVQNSEDFESIKQDMKSGWNIISLIKNGDYYVGIMEEGSQTDSNEPQSVFIPPKKKIKIGR